MNQTPRRKKQEGRTYSMNNTKTMAMWALELLQRMTEAVPPPEGRKHALLLSEDGKGLTLHLTLGVGFLPVILEEEDYAKTASGLADEVCRHIHARADLLVPGRAPRKEGQ